MSKFNVGDKVKCIKDINTLYLTNGREYTVSEVIDHTAKIVVKEISEEQGCGFSYGWDRFELVTPVAIVVNTKQAAEYTVSAKDGKVVITLSGNFDTTKVSDILAVAFN